MEIFVPGIPEAQQRPRVYRRGGKTITVSPHGPWYTTAILAARCQRLRAPLEGPVRVDVDFIYRRPDRVPLSQEHKATRPDLDNLLKGLLDALTKAGIWKDDGCVSELFAVKRYAKPGEACGARILVRGFDKP